MITLLRRSFAVILPVLLLSACTSGVTTSKAGGPGTDVGATALTILAILLPDNFTMPTASKECPDVSVQSEFADLTITIQDPSGVYATQSQGVTFDTYTLTYQPVNQGIPIPLTPRSRGLTSPIPLNGATTVTVTVRVVIVDLETKEEYATRDSGSFNTYNVTLTYHGRDFISGEPITVVATAQIELGSICPTGTEEEGEEGGEEEPAV